MTTMTREELLDISTRYIAYMNEPMKYADDLPLILAKDATLKISYPQMQPGCEGFKQFREKMYAENPDMTYTATQTLADEQECCTALLMKVTGTANEYPASADVMLTDRSFFGVPGKGSFDIYAAIFLKMDPATKMILERSIVVQELQLYQQLGALPTK